MSNQSNSPEIERALDLGQRIQARIQELKNDGRVSGRRSTFVKEAEVRCAGIDRKLGTALARGDLARATALEVERDCDGPRLALARWMDKIAGMR